METQSKCSNQPWEPLQVHCEDLRFTTFLQFQVSVQVSCVLHPGAGWLIISLSKAQVDLFLKPGDHVFQLGVYETQAEVALPLPSQPGTQGSSQYHAQVIIADLRTQIYAVLRFWTFLIQCLDYCFPEIQLHLVLWFWIQCVDVCLLETVNTVHSRLCYILFSVLSLWQRVSEGRERDYINHGRKQCSRSPYILAQNVTELNILKEYNNL